jgi:hypothetical protein
MMIVIWISLGLVAAINLYKAWLGLRSGESHFSAPNLELGGNREDDPIGFWTGACLNIGMAVMAIWIGVCLYLFAG